MKKLLVAILTFQLVFFSPFALADFDAAKYAKNSNVKSGSSSAFGYSVAKTAGGEPYLWSGLKRNAKPSALAKLYKIGGATAAFSAAVYGILGAVDWVMDPENNRVIYEPEIDPNSPIKLFYSGAGMSDYEVDNLQHRISALPQYEQYNFEYWNNLKTPQEYLDLAGNLGECQTKDVGNFRGFWRHQSIDSFALQPLIRVYAETPCITDEEYLGFEEIAEEVIKKADTGDSDAQNDTHKANDPETWDGQEDPNGDPEPELTKNAKPFPCSVKEGAANSCFDDEATTDPDDPTTNKPDDSNDPEPASKVELPAFCDWAKPACNFFVNSFTAATRFYDDVRSHFGKVDELITDIKTPQPTDTEFTESEQQEPEQESELPSVTPITFSTPSACPANPKVNIFLGRASGVIEIPVHLVCFVAEMVRPFVIAGGYLAGASILFRGRES